MRFGELLKTLRERSGLKRAALARLLSVTLPYITNIEKGKQKPPTIERIEQIANALSLTKPDKEKLFHYAAEERIPQKERNLLQRGKPVGIREPDAGYAPEGVQRLPIISWTQLCKSDCVEKSSAACTSNEHLYLYCSGEHLFTLRVQNNSMEPEFREGEIILVMPHVPVNNGDYVIAIDTKERRAMLKQYKQYGSKKILQPLNPKYQDIELNLPDRYVIVGKVIQKIKYY